MIYQDGVLVDEVSNIENEWRDDSVAFLIGCSQTFEAALIDAGLMPRQIAIERTVPMFKTAVPLCAAGGKSPS